MSRVEEDREAQRIEQARIERDRADKRVGEKRLEDNKQFQKVMTSRQESNAQDQQKKESNQQQQSNAAQALMARQGVNAQKFNRGLATGGDARLLAKRSGNDQVAAQSSAHRDAVEKKTHEMEEKSFLGNKGANVGSKGGRGGEGKSQQTHSKSKDESGSAEQQQRLLNVFGPMGGALAPTDGIGAKASQGSGGTSAPLPHQIVDQIVKHVRVGVQALTQTPVVQIDLKDDVLSGSRLTISRGKGGGISVSVQTIDPEGNVARLLSNGDTIKDLSRALEGHDIKLEKLTVDDRTVHEALR